MIKDLIENFKLTDMQRHVIKRLISGVKINRLSFIKMSPKIFENVHTKFICFFILTIAFVQ